MASMEGRQLPGRTAKQWGDLHLVEIDLVHVRKCCSLLVATGKHPMTDATSRALLDSACIRYRRCFRPGVRLPANRELISKLDSKLRTLHEFFLTLTDKHIAHSVNGFEWWSSNVWIEVVGDGTVKRGGLGGTGFGTLMITLDDIARFQSLVDIILERAREYGEALSRKLLEEVARMSDAELLALPEGSSDLEARPRVDRPRRK